MSRPSSRPTSAPGGRCSSGAPRTTDRSLRDCLVLQPEQVIESISESGLRGRGGAGFLTGLKWQLCRAAVGERKYVICNADEGEPGTFKDRVLLTRAPKQVFVGMVICAYAIGGSERNRLPAGGVRVPQGLPGGASWRRCARTGCSARTSRGVEASTSTSASRWVPAPTCAVRSRPSSSPARASGVPLALKPPFPAQQGYLGKPTCIDNVESFATLTSVVRGGRRLVRQPRVPPSRPGTRLLSVAGDCSRPGIYEIEWGITLGEVLDLVGARDARGRPGQRALGGVCPSPPRRRSPASPSRTCSCNGAFTIFNTNRDLLRDRPRLPAVLRRRVLRHLHALPGGQRRPAATRSTWSSPGGPSQRDLDEIVQWGGMVQAHQPMWPRRHVAQADAHHPGEVPRDLPLRGWSKETTGPCCRRSTSRPRSLDKATQNPNGGRQT